jgi:cilia- and flagella-associated protein 52
VSSHTQRMGGINGVALSVDQSTILTVGQERSISYWDLRQPYATNIINAGEECVCVTVSSDGNLFATGGVSQVRVCVFRCVQCHC